MPVTVGVRVGTALIAFIYFLVAGVSNLYGDKPIEVSSKSIIYHVKAKVEDKEVVKEKVPKKRKPKEIVAEIPSEVEVPHVAKIPQVVEVPVQVEIPKNENGKPQEKGVKISYRKDGEKFEINFEHNGSDALSEFDRTLIQDAFKTINDHNKSTFRKIIDSNTTKQIGSILKNLWNNHVVKNAGVWRKGV